jgi:hypothetical protein
MNKAPKVTAIASKHVEMALNFVDLILCNFIHSNLTEIDHILNVKK